MKISTHIATLAVIAATVMIGHASFAQNGSGSAGSGSSSNGTTSTRTEERQDNGPNPGWLGLLGLAGLAGLMKKPQREVVHQTDVRTVNPSNTQNR